MTAYRELTPPLIAAALAEAASSGVPVTRAYLITPGLAAAFRFPDEQLRRASLRRIPEYATAMREGGWVPSDATVTFAAGCELEDGAVRFRVIAEAGVPVLLLVTFSPEPSRRLAVSDAMRGTPGQPEDGQHRVRAVIDEQLAGQEDG